MGNIFAAEKPKDNFPPPPQLLPKSINGGCAGIIGVSVVFPIDLVKTRLQNQVIGPNGERQYKNMLDCFKKTYAQEGLSGMYRGSLVNIIFVAPEKAMKLASNDMFRYYLTLPDGSLPLWRQMLAGAMTGSIVIVITTPMELLKIQMQDAGRIASQAKAAGKTFVPQSAMQITRKLMAERGIMGLYKGLMATGVREVGFAVIYFPMFAIINDAGPKAPGATTAPFWWQFIAGLTAGSVAAVAVTPGDVVKTRMQTLTKGKGEKQFTSVMDCVMSTMKTEGIRALFKGGTCRMMVIAPLFGIAQTIYYIGIGEYLLGIKT